MAVEAGAAPHRRPAPVARACARHPPTCRLRSNSDPSPLTEQDPDPPECPCGLQPSPFSAASFMRSQHPTAFGCWAWLYSVLPVVPGVTSTPRRSGFHVLRSLAYGSPPRVSDSPALRWPHSTTRGTRRGPRSRIGKRRKKDAVEQVANGEMQAVKLVGKSSGW